MFIIFAVFNIFKQKFAMNIRDEEIVRTALFQLETHLEMSNAIALQNDDIVEILGKAFYVMAETAVTKSNYNFIAETLQERAKSAGVLPLLVCGSISEEMMSIAKADGIYTLDTAGNCEITPEGGPFLSLRGRKTEHRRQSSTMVFRTAGLRVLYYFLLDPKNIRKPYREIMVDTDVSVATVKNVVDALAPQYCFESKEGRNLTNFPKLLDFWAEQYNLMYKPRLYVTGLALAPGKQWQDILLPEGIHWGGECGAFQRDGYLIPQSYELYTSIPTRELIKTGQIIPSKDNNIAVYQAFWKIPEADIHPLILYADLMGTADGRCREEAQRIRNNDLSYLL